MRPLRLSAFAATMLWLCSLASFTAVLLGAGRAVPTPPSPLHVASIPDWIATTPTPIVAFALARVIGLGLCAYLCSVTALNLAASLLRLRSLVRAADLFTTPALRLLLRGILGVGMAASTTLSIPVDAWANGDAPTGVATMQLIDEPTPTTTTLPSDGHVATMRPLEQTPPATRDTTDTPRPSPAEAAPTSTTWTIATGDHLWRVSTVTLTQAWGRPPSDAETAGYLARLVEANREVLAVPTNPDLVFTGQVFQLPAPAPAQ